MEPDATGFYVKHEDAAALVKIAAQALEESAKFWDACAEANTQARAKMAATALSVVGNMQAAAAHLRQLIGE